MLFLHLFNRTESSAKTSDLGEFFLDFLQPILSLTVSKVGLRVGSRLTAILLVQVFAWAEQDWNISPFQNLS
jgi:hypothetical protein